MNDSLKFQFAIDRGGTFTDVFARCPNGKIRVMKLLSVDPANYNDAPREGIRRIMEQELGIPIPNSEPIDGSYIEWIRMGTTVATNALLERKGERMALVINKGFRDLLYIGNQARPRIFDLEVITPEVLYEEVVEVDCRVVPAMSGRCKLQDEGENVKEFQTWKRVIGTTKEELLVCKELDVEDVKSSLEQLKSKGISAIAVVLAHSYMYPDHEVKIADIAQKIGFTHVSLSHQVMPMVRIVSRGFTACADAYLTPHIKQYIQGFASGFKKNLENVNVLFMQSDGGLTPMHTFNGSRAILSGPAGGVVGYAVTTYGAETNKPVIGFDMGGTSTDVSRFAGTYEHVFESTTAGVTIQAPQLDINTVAAGGGSMLFFRSGLFVVGPESAGAHPGPVCYRKGGPLTVTDANLMLGRLLPDYFPKIFGEKENEPLDKLGTEKAFRDLTLNINNFLATQRDQNVEKKTMTIEDVAIGFIRVANETMCRPIRALTQAKGFDTRHHVLACFGGAGGQHACSIARSLGMGTVFVHKYAGILSAYGMALADVVHEAQEPCSKVYTAESFTYIDERISSLAAQCKEKLKEQGFKDDQIKIEPYLHLRYEGTDCALMCTATSSTNKTSTKHGDFYETFIKRYQTEFGFVLSQRNIIVDDIRVRGVGTSIKHTGLPIAQADGPPKPVTVTKVYFDNGYEETPVYLLMSLLAGHVVKGPAIIIDDLSTILVEPDCTANITDYGDIKIIIGSGQTMNVDVRLDSIQLSIFSHRFMSIAEQMGRILQRTSLSTNIKERLDFSCALFGPDGGLVSNAPHIPVHLGSMQEAVQYQIKAFNGKFTEGNVILSNHPKAGGTHLPDLTVITPVFYKGEPNPVFFVASRGHHADIGGITPGSMPPHSKLLLEEGANFKSFLLVKEGVFNEKALIDAFNEPSKLPGSSGTRCLQDNLSDLKAQIAANQKGILLVGELIDYYGLDVVQAYMKHIQTNAELAVRDLLKQVGKNTYELLGHTTLEAEEYMDDGTPISLKVTIDIEQGTAVFDFSGTGFEVWGNCNAPRAVTVSALIYCLRCMVGHDLPLNQGCLKPVTLVIPEGSILDPSDDAAVVGGNVLTSQRIVDTILKAFQVCAASQGCMNNTTFGDDTFGYYETVAGGAGAGPTWNGKSGIHTHMTNARMTDAEILERRYPVILKHFSLREGSGGQGKYSGGDGVIRELLFRKDIILSVLTERRVFYPYGLFGGAQASKGLNLLMRANGRIINLGSKSAVAVRPGDTFKLFTPGGGGYGSKDEKTSATIGKEKRLPTFIERGSVFEYTKSQESV